MKRFIPFVLLFLCIFYVLPFIIHQAVILLILTPILLLISAIFFGGFFGFSILLALLCFICALPLILTSGAIFFVYIIAYFAVTIIGNLLGLLFKSNKSKE